MSPRAQSARTGTTAWRLLSTSGLARTLAHIRGFAPAASAQLPTVRASLRAFMARTFGPPWDCQAFTSALSSHLVPRVAAEPGDR